MRFPLKNRISGRVIFVSIVIIISFCILYLSIIRASLDIMTKDNDENKLRVEPIEFLMNKKNGPEKCVYKFPEVKTLPDNSIYKIKAFRDFMWIAFTHDPLAKAKITLLIADKKMVESLALYKKNNYKLALDTSEEAINKLKYADKVVLSKQLQTDIVKAGLAYKEVLIMINIDKKLDQDKYNKIIIDLDGWNEEKQKSIKEI